MDKSKGNKSTYVYIEDFDHEDFEDLFTIKLSIKKKKAFWMNCLQCFGEKEILTNYCKVCLEIKDKQGNKILKKLVMYNLVIITSSYHLLL